jgi:DNA repair exonuclease SbcCD ATPase subunit
LFSFELSERNDQIQQLENYQHLTHQELQQMIKEKERIRVMLTSEQKTLKEKLLQQKEINHQLKQTINDLKNEYEKKEHLLNKELKEYKENYYSLSLLKEKEKKEITKLQNKEYTLQTNKNEVRKTSLSTVITYFFLVLLCFILSLLFLLLL